MATRAQRRGLNGVSSLRKKLRNMEKVLQSDIGKAIAFTSQQIVQDARGGANIDTGDLAASIEFKQSSDGFSSTIGPGARAFAAEKRLAARRGKAGGLTTTKTGQVQKLSGANKKKLFDFFKGLWQEFGTKGTPARNIPAQPAKPFMGPAFEANKRKGVDRIARAVNNQLKRISKL